MLPFTVLPFQICTRFRYIYLICETILKTHDYDHKHTNTHNVKLPYELSTCHSEKRIKIEFRSAALESKSPKIKRRTHKYPLREDDYEISCSHAVKQRYHFNDVCTFIFLCFTILTHIFATKSPKTLYIFRKVKVVFYA